MPTTDASPKVVFEAIPAHELDTVRTSLVDEAGNRLSCRVETDGRAPLRCCLRLSREGERLLLIAYTPPGSAGPYAERGPVFVHAEVCPGYDSPGTYPAELSDRPQVVRAYDHEGRIADGVLTRDGEEAARVISALLGRPEVALVHLRNVGYGCYNFAVRRA